MLEKTRLYNAVLSFVCDALYIGFKEFSFTLILKKDLYPLVFRRKLLECGFVASYVIPGVAVGLSLLCLAIDYRAWLVYLSLGLEAGVDEVSLVNEGVRQT